ncbi:MAG: hypothetical protein KDE68_03750 [Rhodocyclaceae bacterium]|nr:hypothetical protein [Rhodocyclaceae bacterium]
MSTADDDDGSREALAAMKAVHAAGGRAVSKAEAIEFIIKPVNLGRPKTPPYKGRGRRPTRNQYDEAFYRRKGLYQRLVRLPSLRTNSGDVPRDLIVDIGRQLKHGKVQKRDLARRVEQKLAAKGIAPPHRDNIRRHLKKAGLLS